MIAASVRLQITSRESILAGRAPRTPKGGLSDERLRRDQGT
jgi:hypothetical protein